MSKASLFNTGGWLFLYLFNTGGWVSLTRGATSVYHGGLPLFNTGAGPKFRTSEALTFANIVRVRARD